MEGTKWKNYLKKSERRNKGRKTKEKGNKKWKNKK